MIFIDIYFLESFLVGLCVTSKCPLVSNFLCAVVILFFNLNSILNSYMYLFQFFPENIQYL